MSKKPKAEDEATVMVEVLLGAVQVGDQHYGPGDTFAIAESAAKTLEENHAVKRVDGGDA